MRVFGKGDKAGKITLRSFFISKVVFKSIMVLFLSFTLNGCALLGLLLRLAPIAAAVLVEYSPPVQTEDGQILCVKALRHVERQQEKTRILRSEYFLVMLDDKRAEVVSSPLEIGEEYYNIEEFNFNKIDNGTYALHLIDKEWEVELRELSVFNLQPLAVNY